MNSKMFELLGNEADDLLNHQCNTVSKEHLHLPGPDFVDRVDRCLALRDGEVTYDGEARGADVQALVTA